MISNSGGDERGNIVGGKAGDQKVTYLYQHFVLKLM